MLDTVANSIAPTGFMPHGYCFLWTPPLLWTYVLSDSIIAVSYFSIPFALWYIGRRRRDLPFPSIFMLFGAFVLACGATHLFEVWNIWHADYWADAGLKALTAIVSFATAILLWVMMPKILSIPSHAQLESANRELQDQMRRRERAEADLQRAHDALERRVAERTAELETANKSLRESEARYRAVTQSARDAIVTADATGAIVGWNLGAKILFGYTETEASGQPLTLLMPRAYHDRHLSGMARIVSGGEPHVIGKAVELEGLRKDGSVFPFELSLAKWETSEGQFFTGIIRDITERKRADESLRDSEEGLRAIFEGALDGIMVADVATRRILTANAAACDMLGYTPEEIIGIGVSDIHPKEYLPRVSEQFERQLRGEMRAAVETPVVRNDGTVFYADIKASPIRLGGRNCLLGLFHDVTARKEAERQLRESEERFRSLTEMSSDFYWETDAEHHFTAHNSSSKSSQVQEFRQGMQIGKRRWELPYLSPDEAGWQAHRAVLDARQPFRDFMFSRRGVDDAARYLMVSGDPVFDASGAFKGYRGVGTDITERKQAELALSRQKDLYNALSQTNQVILRGTTREELFQSVCRIVVEQGRLMFAWVGLISKDDMYMRPTAQFGNDAGYMATLHTAMSDRSVPRSGLSWLAVNSGAHTVANDFLTHPATAARHEDARRCGIRAFAAFPIRQSGEVIGVINVYADESGYFTDDLLATLDEMALDVSFALDNIEHDAARRRMEDGLRAAEEQFRGLVEQSIAGIYIIQDGKLVYVNPRAAAIVGQGSADELIGVDPLLLVAEADRGTVADTLRRLLSGEVRNAALEFAALRRDGAVIQVGANAARATRDERPAVIGMLQDISEKKRAEEEIQRYVRQLETAFMSTVEVATTLSEMRDPYTVGHERRVAEIAVAIGAELGLDERRQEGLRVAGHLHDIGKITIPSEILSKPGKLSEIEYRLIQGHPQASYDVLKNVEFPWPVAQVALQHHERLDGGGYPQGLKSEAILLEARIMAVADVMEAMSSHRPYRPGLGIDKALAEVERGRGTAYDTDAADACLRLFRDKGYRLPD